MAFENTKVREQNGLDKQESEESGGMSMSPPAFNVTASAGTPPVQRQAVDGDTTLEGGERTAAPPLTAEQITAARSQNEFLLEVAAAVNAFQAGIGATASGTFDDATITAIAAYQTANTITSTPGIINQATLDHVVRAMVAAGNQAGVATIARDFFQLDKRTTQVAVEYNAALTESAQMNNDAAHPVLNLGPTAFTDGLTSLGTALDSALGAGTSIANQSWGVLEASNRTQRQNAMWSNPDAANEAGLAVWVREQFPTEAQIREYMSRQDVTQADKVATIGQLSVELGRLEFLMGVIFHGGTDQSWESAGANRGPFVNHFKAEVGNGANDAPWCTMFSGYLRRMLGFSDELAGGGPLIFNAGLRLDRWATDGTNLLTGRDDFDDPGDYENYSGGSIDQDEWVTLRTALNRRGITDEERQTEVTNFFSTRITPQPGDIMVINTGSTTNAYRNRSQSHTVNVEAYNGTTVSTIEGNRGDKVTGVTLDLSDPADAGQVIIMARLGAEFFPHDDPQPATPEGAEGQEGDAPAQPVSQITRESLLQPLQAMTRELQLLASRRSYISSDAAGASVATMAGPNNTGGDL